MLSVIVHLGGNQPLRKENALLCLQRIKVQIYKEYELVVVEQSLDGKLYWKDITEFIFPARKYQAIYGDEYCGAWARNVGSKLAANETLVIVDADTMIRSDYLLQLNKHFRKAEGYAIGYSCCHRLNREGRDLYLQKHDLSRIDGGSLMYSFEPDFRMACGAIMVIEKVLLLDIGGYNEAIHFKEDKDLVWRLMMSRLMTQHDGPHVLPMTIVDLPHERLTDEEGVKREFHSSYVSTVFKHCTQPYPVEVSALLHKLGTGCYWQRQSVDMVHYFRTGGIRYLETTNLTHKEYQKATGDLLG